MSMQNFVHGLGNTPFVSKDIWIYAGGQEKFQHTKEFPAQSPQRNPRQPMVQALIPCFELPLRLMNSI